MGAKEEKEQQNEKSRSSSNQITEAQFLSWKRQKDADASARKAEAARKRAKNIAAGTVQMNGIYDKYDGCLTKKRKNNIKLREK